MSVRLFLAASVPILCSAHRRAQHDVHEAERGLEKGHVLQFLPQSLQEEVENYRLPPDSSGNNGNSGLIWGIITGVVIVLLVLCSYCYFHLSLLPLPELEGDGQTGNAQEIEEGERGVLSPQMAPADVADSSPDSAKMEAGQVVRDQSSSKFEIEIEDFRTSGVELDGQPPDSVRVQQVEEGSSCHLQGLRAGDRLVKAGSRLINVAEMTPATFQEVLQTRPVRLQFQRFGLDAAGSVLAGLGRWTQKAKQAAAAAMAQEEDEIQAPQVAAAAASEEDWSDGIPEADKRIFPRPNLVRYKWVLRTCFEHDWKFIRARLVRDLKFTEAEVDEAEQCLRTKYMWVLPLYRKLSSEETSEGGSSPDHISQFGVSKRSLMRILGPEGISIFDKATVTQAKASELYKQANCVPQDVAGFKVRCDAVLCRFQFAELLVRIAICKWPEKSKAEALDRLFEELAVLCQKYSGDMRELITSGSTDEVQAVYEAIEPQTWAVFVEMASVHENTHGQKYMTLQDWRNLLNRMNIFVLYPVVKRKYGAYTYRMGLEPQADEQYNKTWQLMSFLEFQRALGAVMFLSEMRPKKECKPEILAALLKKIATENLSQIATAKPTRKKLSVLEGKIDN
eukprot:s1455_g16.t1